MGLPSVNLVTSVVKKNKRGGLLKDLPLYIMLLPAFLLVLVFSYIPMYGIIIAFKDYSPFTGILKSEWVGFYNFIDFLKDAMFWKVVMRNTLIINFYDLLFGFPAPIILALMINEIMNEKIKRPVQTITYLPHFLSWVVIQGIAIAALSPQTGLINIALKSIGIKPIYFLGSQVTFRGTAVAIQIWKDVGFSSILYLAALTGIDKELYDAAYIDGAGRFRQTWHITLPGIQPTIFILLILQLGHMMSIGFDRIFLLYNPLVYDVGDVISTYVYRHGLQSMEFSRTTALGLSQAVVNFVLLTGTNWLSRRKTGSSLW